MLFSIVAAPVCSLSVISARRFSSGMFPAGEVLGLTVGGDAVSTGDPGTQGLFQVIPKLQSAVCRADGL